MHAGLLNHLQFAIWSPKECDGTRQRTETWLLEHAHPDPVIRLTVVEAALDWLTEHAGRCDCTVIVNTFPDGVFRPRCEECGKRMEASHAVLAGAACPPICVH